MQKKKNSKWIELQTPNKFNISISPISVIPGLKTEDKNNNQLEVVITKCQNHTIKTKLAISNPKPKQNTA